MVNAVSVSQVNVPLESICELVHEFEDLFAAEIAVHPDFRESARNVVGCLALWRTGLRDLKEDLASMGWSPLGTLEGNRPGSGWWNRLTGHSRL